MPIPDQAPLEDFVEDEIKKAFNEYLGMPLDEMDHMGQSIYAPDYDIFKAGWLASRSNGVANNVFDLTK